VLTLDKGTSTLAQCSSVQTALSQSSDVSARGMPYPNGRRNTSVRGFALVGTKTPLRAPQEDAVYHQKIAQVGIRDGIGLQALPSLQRKDAFTKGHGEAIGRDSP
jgi:hypothetical protein